MTRGQGLLLAGLAVAAVAVWAVLLGQLLGEDPGARPTSVAAVSPSATTDPTQAPSPSVAPTSAPESASPIASTEPPAPPDATKPPTELPVGSGGRPAFLAFLARLDAARAEAEDLNAELREAGEASDTPAVRATAADMDELVDRERDWLAANPPDPCYADAHDAADDLLAAYGSVATAANAWADASGLDVLSALARLYDAVEAAAAEAVDVGQALKVVSCAA